MLTIVTLGYFAAPLSAQTVWDGTADISWFDVSQTSFDISTPEQLAGVASLVNSGSTTFNGVTLNLTNDLWLNAENDSTNNWIPIGGSATATTEAQSSGNSFQGAFNGHGHSIYNLYCDKTNYFHAGFFGCIQNPCTIDSVVFINPTVKSCGMMGVIAGMTRSGGAINIRYCLVINANVVGTPAGGSSPSASHNNIGCIVGANYPNTSGTTILNCGATGNVSGYYAGGLGGNSQYETFTNCYFAGYINNYNNETGGITAYSGTRNNCYSYCTFASGSGNGGHGTVVTQDEMQSEDMITNLGEAFKMDNGVNNGYPIMSYMAGIDPIAAEICQGESIELTAFGFDSYVWSTGATSESIIVSPTTTTTYTVTCTSNGVPTVLTSTITVFPQAVINAMVVPSSDGQTHATLNQESFTVGCGSSDNITLVVTPDVNYRVSRITLNGTQLFGDEFGEGTVSVSINPGGTLGEVKVFLSNEYAVSITELLDTGDTLHLSNLVQPYGSNGVVTVTSGSNQSFSFNNTARYALTDATIDGISQGVITSYEFLDIHENHTIEVTYADSCGISSLPFVESFEGPTNVVPECYEKISDNSYPYTYNYNAHSGSNSIYCYMYSTSTDYLLIFPKVLDTITYPMNELMVTFWARTSNTSNSYTVGVMSDPTDASTFTAAQSFNPTATNTYEFFTAYIGNAGYGKPYIAIKFNCGSTYTSTYIDDVTVDFAPLCSPVTNLTTENVFGSNVTLTWGPNMVGEASEYNIVVQDLTNETEESYTTSETSYILTGLTELTSYQIGVFTSCTNGQTSDTAFISFMTPCNSPVNYSVGNSTTTNNYLPTYIFYGNTYSQQIVTADVFEGAANDFASISVKDNSTAATIRACDIYLAHVPAGMDLSNGWILPSSSNVTFTQVFSGNVNFGTGDWVKLDFDTVFPYNGTDNVLVVFNDHTNSYTSSHSFDVVSNSNTSSMARYAYRDGTPYDAFNPGVSGTVLSVVNTFRLSYCDESSCLRPNTLATGAVSASSAEISWFNPNSTQNCEIEYKTDADEDWISVGSVSGSDYTFSGLEPNTLYQVRVRALCGSDEQSIWSESISFRTDCVPITADDIPYVQNFDGNDNYGSGEDAYVFCWDRYTNNSSSPVYYSTSSSAHSLSGMLRFDDGSNVTNIAIMPQLDESLSLSELQISFWVKNTSSSSTAILELGVMTDKDDPTTFETLDTIVPQVVNQYNLIEYSLADYTGYGQYIAFRVSNGNGGNNFRLDDVTLDYIPMCLHPVDLAVGDVTSESVTIQWSWEGNASSWIIEYGPAGFTPGEGNGDIETASDTFAVINGLNPNTLYDFYVYADCGGGLVSTPISISVRTDCGLTTITADNPWFEDFEGYSGGGAQSFVCWETPVTEVVDNGTSPFVYCGHSPSCHSGANSAELKGTNNMLVLPEFSNDLQDLRLSFWATTTNTSNYGTVEIGYITDITDPTTFVALGPAGVPGPRGSSGSGHGNFMGPFDFNGVTATSARMAIKFTGYSGLSWNLDDFTVSLAPNCPSPVKTSVQASNIDGHNATITFTDNDPDHNSWTVYYRQHSAAADDPWTPVTTNTTSVNLTNLDPETTYDVYVVTNCSTPDEVEDATLTIQFTTLIACPAPQNVTVSNIGMTSATVTWFSNADSFTIEYGETGFSQGTGTIVTTTDNTYDLIGLTSGTSYTVYITADCGIDGTSSATSANFNTSLCEVEDQCEYTFNLNDSYGDGWNGGTLAVQQNGITVITLGLTSGSSATIVVNLCHGVSTSLVWSAGSYASEASFTVTGPDGAELYASPTMNNYSTYTFMPNCSGCAMPTALTVSNLNTTSATISWTGSANSYILEYGEAGFTPGTGTTVTVTTTTYDLAGLSASTNYSVYIISDCGEDATSSAAILNFTTPICDASEQCVYTLSMTDSYGDGWNGASLTVQQNGITVGTYTLSTGLSSGSETISLCDNLTTTLVWSSGTFDSECSFSLTDPSGTEVYTTSSVSAGTLTTFTSDCGGSGPVITDPTVATVAASAIEQTTATLNATITNPDNVTITAKGFEWKATAGGTYTQIAGTGTGNTFMANLSGLTANTGYTYKAFITFEGTTVYGEEMTFTTLPEDTPEPCNVPTNLHTTDIQNEAISIAWDADANVTSWNIQYRPVGGTLATATSNTNSYTITGLTGLTTYEIQVQANCGDGNLSDWTAAITPQTTNVGIESYLSNSVVLFPNPAKELINVQCTMYNVQSVEVIDVYGKVINTISVTDNPTRINVSGLANGMYFVRVTTEMGVVTKQFVKR